MSLCSVLDVTPSEDFSTVRHYTERSDISDEDSKPQLRSSTQVTNIKCARYEDRTVSKTDRLRDTFFSYIIYKLVKKLGSWGRKTLVPDCCDKISEKTLLQLTVSELLVHGQFYCFRACS